MGKKKPALRALSTGRPPIIKRKAKSISRKETRTLINSHHTLQKQRQQAILRNDTTAVSVLNTRIQALGGIEEYQRASLQGQRCDRGGDSSKLLLEWLHPARLALTAAAASQEHYRMLEVGALSTANACSSSGLFQMELIDLHSQQPGILQQDFMERPLPTSVNEKFDIISLSLVLNYVPDAATRGQMLLRTLAFLHDPAEMRTGIAALLPSLFLVLPRSCVDNSRYCSLERLTELMSMLGYTQTHAKFTNKLAYFLWKRESQAQCPVPAFPKKEVNPGGNRNNFALVIRPT